MAANYDVIVIGSGVAGALCAWKLTQLGNYRILILEAGHNGITEGQRIIFHHMMDTQGARGDMFAPYVDLESRKFALAPEKAQRSLPDQRADSENYYEYTPDVPGKNAEPFKASYNRMVGGSSWSWRGNTPRFIPSDFKLRTNFGVGRDWPLDYDDLEPWYCKAEQELGVSGNHDEWDGLLGGYRTEPFPMPGIVPSYSDRLVTEKIKGKTVRGTTVRVVTTPQARNSRVFDGRPACEGHSVCIPLCPIQAKYDATVHLRKLLQNKSVELKSASVVTRITTGKNGRVDRVYFKDWLRDDPSKERNVSAPVVVIAAHAIETPRILLHSRVANSSGMVGCNLMDHVQFEVTALFPEPVYPFRGPQSIVSIEEFRDGAHRSKRSAFRMTIGNDGWGRSGSPATVLEDILKDSSKFGSALPGLVADRIPKMVRLSYSTEMLPEPENRIQLATSPPDPLGVPKPLLTFDIGAYAKGGLIEGFRTAEELFGLMGAAVRPGQAPEKDGKVQWNTAAHIMGTCIMGADPKDSVVDRWGRSHDVANLWIVGSSVFATSATANPTLTLAALSLRTASAIHRDWLRA